MCLGRIERLAEVWDEGPARRGRAECGAELSLAFTPDAAPGSYVVAQSGIAVALLSEDDAAEALAVREEFGA
jgi:hydrogenase expression/formation protein HypC